MEFKKSGDHTKHLPARNHLDTSIIPDVDFIAFVVSQARRLLSITCIASVPRLPTK